ncbi:deoxyribodipyrimidine photo-lyase [Arthrobacter sp. APC 3897]|uniref:cryptochrome/photolyase family protein n=1 Tax=Arthrobacter sp. APC 3897 TaxID=3035204 RepID=UPI0025B5E8CA|nr:deoxyribodipyrimidine photo-lyase [Arthrobacter sp. APC 3897]MDN3480366.1 deoxyribodipyrimidine photo-lyase [Arthrobacter sp. APC 3897]
MPVVSIVWLRDDLRTADNPALLAAVHGGEAAALYVLDEESPGIRPLGAAAKWWLHHALKSLREDLDALGIPLVLLRGPAGEVVPAFVQQSGAEQIFWNRRYGGPEREVDTAVKERAAAEGVHAESFQASLLHEPWTVRTGSGGPYRVFTPFWRTVSAMDFRAPLSAPEPAAAPPAGIPSGVDLDDWNLLPQHPDWTAGLAEAWIPGEEAGMSALSDFLGGPVENYDDGRDRPAKPGTSRLSPYLRWGHVSPFQVWHELSRVRGKGPGPDVFGTEIGWREFCWHQLFHNPDLATKNLRPAFDGFPWDHPEGAGPRTPAILRGKQAQAPLESRPEELDPLDAWKAGRTGIPLVDAGQRQLWSIGWMHNRVRMVTASFLIKNLGIHWRVGEEWFWETLVDADPASNPANWQWVAGSGADAAPFFRIFNPQTQAKRFDPDGAYIARWVPQALTPAYPEPLVDLTESRRHALEAYESIR